MAEQFDSRKYVSIGKIVSKFSMVKDVELVYGKPIESQNRTVLPVAKVTYRGGGGGGFSHKDEAGGEGLGGEIKISPVGVYEITPTETVFKPVIDLKLMTLIMAVLSVGCMVLFKKKIPK